NDFTNTDPARSLRQGHIGLQNHGDGDEVAFRNVRIKQAGSPSGPRTGEVRGVNGKCLDVDNAGVVTEFVRNTPLLVQLFFLFYVLPEWGITASALTTGVFAIGLHYSTYTMQVYRAGIDAVPVGQWEAATALNLPLRRTWTVVILPQAVRRVVPALGNYVISMLKDTPLLMAITVLEMLGEARLFAQQNFQFTEPLTVIGVAFIVISYLASLALRALERRLVH
ncbi:ectoine/hydroxyectoine ABC transporter permease subunit EhuD, partial [Micromonospora chersina]